MISASDEHDKRDEESALFCDEDLDDARAADAPPWSSHNKRLFIPIDPLPSRSKGTGCGQEAIDVRGVFGSDVPSLTSLFDDARASHESGVDLLHHAVLAPLG